MALGKLGAFLNKDLGALAKDARKALNTDVGTIAKGAGRVLQSDLGELLRDAPEADKPAEEVKPVVETPQPPVAKKAPPAPVPAAIAFDPEATQKMERMPVAQQPAPANATPFDPDVTQKMMQTPAAESKPKEMAPAASGERTKFDRELLIRTQRTLPGGTEIKELLPYTVGDFERPRAAPSGNLTNDPVNAIYAGGGETVQVQLALCWDADEATDRIKDVVNQIGVAARAPADRTWVIGPTPQGLTYAWSRDCYFFSATSAKGAPALERFLSNYPY